MNRFTLIAAASMLSAAGSVLAQGPGYNIDVGVAGGRPNLTYGAASGQIGYWSNVAGTAATNLRNLATDAVTADTIVVTGIAIGNFNNPNTAANHQLLMDDFMNLGPAGTFQQYTITLNTLAAPQWYAVWTYSWGPNPATCSGAWVNVPGSIDPAVLVNDCGNWPAGVAGAAAFTLWQHFSYHEILVAPGMPIVVNLQVAGGSPNNGRLNGVQLVPLAGPDPNAGDGIPPNYNGNDSTSCPADWNADGVVNSQDFLEFTSAFFAASPEADLNSDNAINSQDYFEYVNEFFSGC